MSFNADDVAEGPSGLQSHVLPCNPGVAAPSITARVVGDPTQYQVKGSRRFRARRTVSIPLRASLSKGRQKRLNAENRGPSKKSRHSPYLKEIDINILNYSGSGGDDEAMVNKTRDDEKENAFIDIGIVEDIEGGLDNEEWKQEKDQKVNVQEKKIKNTIEENACVVVKEIADVVEEGIENDNIVIKTNVNERGRRVKRERRVESKRGSFTGAAVVDEHFVWSDDFSSFTGQKESYSRVPGPAFSSQDPVDIFYKIWDCEFMEIIVRETNKYALEVISHLSDPDMGTGIPDYLGSWTDITIEELYRYFAIFIFISYTSDGFNILDYWDTGIMEMSEFRRVMSWKRFALINKFLHFVSNDVLLTRGDDHKIEKVAPLVDHCNHKFAEMYTPHQHLSLYKSSLSRQRCMRSKAARFGIKSFELYEAETGYLLRYRLYKGKEVEMHPKLSLGLQEYTSKVVSDFLEGYLDVGHVLIIDKLCNQFSLTRYLKTRRTDVLGMFDNRHKGIPRAIKNVTSKNVEDGTCVGRHSGDIALVGWKDIELVTAISTYHQHVMVPVNWEGEETLTPAAVQEYHRYMGDVKNRNQQLVCLMDRSRNQKWHMKVFCKLLEASLRNAFIIYTKNPMYQVDCYQDFRLRVAEGIFSRYPPVSPLRCRVPETTPLPPLRLQLGNHFPGYMEAVSGARIRPLRCVRCTALKRRVVVRIICTLCQVPLCLGPCWIDYHSLLDLK